MYKQKYFIISVSGGKYNYELRSEFIGEFSFLEFINGLTVIKVKDMNGVYCQLLTDKIELIYKDGKAEEI